MVEQKKKNKVYIIDTTNRDGVQTSRIGLAKLEKTIINLYLNEMGIYQSEFGFPTTPHEVNYINANLKLAEMGVLKPIILSGWVRGTVEDVEEAVEKTKVKNLNLSLPTSDVLIKNQFGGEGDIHRVIQEMTGAVDKAKELGIEVVGVDAEDASRTELEHLLTFARVAKEHGAERFRYCDTVGYDDPRTLYSRVKTIAETVEIPMEIHCHNDLGMAVANSIEGARGAIEAGVDAYINTTINGIGERAGNADLLSVCLALRKSSGFKKLSLLDERVDLSKVWKIAKYASYAFGIPLPLNQVGVGANIFAYESGVHLDGALRDMACYELYELEELGRGEPEVIETGRMITTGEYGGIKGFRDIYGRLEISFRDEAEATTILELVRYANVHTQKALTEDELRFIAKFPQIARKIMTMNP